MKVSVSFLKSNKNLEDTINTLSNTNCDYLHVDIMDGNFVSNTTYEFNEIETLLLQSKKELDVHLMVQDPSFYIIKYAKLKPVYITIHKEINHDINSIIDLIHSYNILAGISIKPNTKIEEIEPYLNKIDQVLVMSVEPGKGGQEFIMNSIHKINKLKEIRDINNYNYIINVDGGINNKTIYLVNNSDMIVSGSFVCMSNNYQESINILKDI